MKFINEKVIKNLPDLNLEFNNAKGTKCVCIDDFFTPDIAKMLLDDFPSFDKSQQKNEFGDVGLKAVYERLSEISEGYKGIAEYFASNFFNTVIQNICGDETVFWGGETMYGGGTHENLNGSELDQHIDFNYNDLTKEHRRLNLLIYLNPTWSKEWGGNLELHTNPNDPLNNEVRSFTPIFNRAVLMETTEKSWHGFPRINIPSTSKVNSRKSLALYFYSKSRPADEVHGGHGTYYIHRLPPQEFAVGATVSQNCFDDINHIIAKRDSFLALYQEREKESATRLEEVINYNSYLLSKIRLPIIGMASQLEAAEGFFPEGFIGLDMSVKVQARSKIKGLALNIYARESLCYPLSLSVKWNQSQLTQTEISDHGVHTIEAELDLENNDVGTLVIEVSHGMSGAEELDNGDQRVFSVLLESVTFISVGG